MRYRPTAKLYFFIFVAVTLILGYCGGQLPDNKIIPGLTTFQVAASDLNSVVWLSRVATLYYFAYFVLILPILGLTETPLPQPESISEPVLSHSANAPLGAAASPEKRG
jgi:quinol-cytochrome oxidoreductase complex cytochrome b subunit